MCLVFNYGCSRKKYRIWADQETSHLVAEHQRDAVAEIPARSIEARPESRLADHNDPDCGPRPFDDPNAEGFLLSPNGYRNDRYWNKIPQGAAVDSGDWLLSLPRNENNEVELTREFAIDLALLHSRQYQTQYENLHLSALDLSAQRFDLETQFFGRSSTDYFGQGKGVNASKLVTQTHQNGFARNLAAGGQFATTLLNSLSWDILNSGFSTAGGSLVFALTQPLLRGAFRFVRLENLSQSERNLLYLVRDFARFRRQFYLNRTTEFLSLLQQSQALKNQRANLSSLQLNLEEFELMFSLKMLPQIQVDQVFQEYQSGRIGILQSEQQLQDSLDQFKFTLGLPPYINLKIDESYLDSFELNDPKLDAIQDRADVVYQRLLQFIPPDEIPADIRKETTEEIAAIESELVKLLPTLFDEVDRWQIAIDEMSNSTLSTEQEIDLNQQKKLYDTIVEQMGVIKEEFEKFEEQRGDLGSQLDRLAESKEADSIEDLWRLLTRDVGQRLKQQISALFIIQTQVRLFLIEINSVDIEQETAVEFALANRLDLKNQRARVNDAFRRVEIAADNLQSDLSVTGTATLNTDSNRSNAFGFDSNEQSYQLGAQFDGPYNRLVERNGYRAAQIAYQRERRTYMATEDAIANQIRSDLRRLRISELNFQISRQQLIAATRQVDEAQFNLRSATEAGSNLTRDLLQALQGLLNAKNNLVSNWISYELARISLFVDMELLYLDEEGKWINDTFDLGELSSVVQDALDGGDNGSRQSDGAADGFSTGEIQNVNESAILQFSESGTDGGPSSTFPARRTAVWVPPFERKSRPARR